MVLTKEYRICMPITVEEYKIGQLYMIARHSLEQSGDGEGVEVVENKECYDSVHGKGQFTEKRIHLSTRFPYWIQAIVPKIFYVTEKAWNYYPFTLTEYSCSFVPRFRISIQSKYEDNNGSNDNCLNLPPEQLTERIVDHIDIAYDEVSPKHYKETEDLRFFQSKKTLRGPLVEGWRASFTPVMCSYKVVSVSLEIFGLQTKLEDYIHSCIREVLLLGHRQAFAWIDEWVEMSLEDVRKFEAELQDKTNLLLTDAQTVGSSSTTPISDLSAESNEDVTPPSPRTPQSPKSPTEPRKGYFSWF